MAKLKVHGVVTPLITPFTETGEVYEKGLRNLLDFQIEKGIHGVFVCGSYGSGPLMSTDQRKKVVEVATEHVKERMVIVAHVGAASTEETVELAKHAEREGVDAVAAIPPYYYGHDEETVIEHHRQLVEAVSIPVYAYNNPKTCGFTITPSALVKLADLGARGMKDSGMSIATFSQFVARLSDRKDFRFMIGSETLLLPAMLLGAKGCVSGLANVFPEIVVELYDTVVRKDYEGAAKLQLKTTEARRILHIAKSTIAACYPLLKERGVDVGGPRRPILPVTDEELNLMRKEYTKIGLLNT